MENLWESLNGLLCRNKSGPSPLLDVSAYWKSSNTYVWSKKLSHILANNFDNWLMEVGLKTYLRYYLKKINERKNGHWESRTFFCFNSLFLMFWSMVNGFMTNYSSAWRFWPSRNWTVKLHERYDEFLLLKENILSNQSVLFIKCYIAKTGTSFSIFLMEYTNKVLKKLSCKDHTISCCL